MSQRSPHRGHEAGTLLKLGHAAVSAETHLERAKGVGQQELRSNQLYPVSISDALDASGETSAIECKDIGTLDLAA